jgi:hypothetical protein
MPKAKHRKQASRWRFWYMVGITTAGLAVIAACAAVNPTPAQSQQPPQTAQPAEWKAMAVQGMEYACDPVLGVLVKHEWEASTGAANGRYHNWTVSVVPYTQLSSNQRQQMCEINR